MITMFSWCCTILVLIGFVLNSKRHFRLAMLVWICGDLGWVVYDYYINNFSHLALSFVIIFINLYGLYNIKINKLW